MSKIITVFGATGSQGGSVIRSILSDPVLSKSYKIRAVTRDVSKPASQALAKQGVELVSADLTSKSSVLNAVKGAHTVFLVTTFWETFQPGIERIQGFNVADASKESGVSFLIYSSLLHVTKITDGRLKHVHHFDEKAEVEEHIRQSGVPSAFFLPGYFMSNFTQNLTKTGDGAYMLTLPVNEEARFPLFNPPEDTGKWVKAMIKNQKGVIGKQILGATAYYTPREIVSQFEETTGKKANFVQATPEQFKQYLPPPIAQEMLENHLFIDTPGYFNGASLDDSLAILEDEPTTWKQFLNSTDAFD